MKKILSVKNITVCAVCISLCSILPMAFHSIGLGSAFSPMHLPVLLCGMLLGGGYGLVCGVVGPILSSVITGMPGAPMLLTMVPELMAYGLVSGLCMRFVRTGKAYPDMYISLLAAMICGRLVGGAAGAAVYLGRGQAYSVAAWISSYFVGTLPGIVCQLVLIPLLVLALTKARVIPARYEKVR